MNQSITSLTPKELRRAADLKERIDALQHELDGILGAKIPAHSRARAKRRTFSAATRARMRSAQKARWTRIKGATLSSAPSTRKLRRKVSAAARAKLSALAKERWKKAKAAGKKAL